MDLLKVILICVFMFLMSRETISQNINGREAVHHTIKDHEFEKHMQKREHQGLIPQILKLGKPISLPKQTVQARPRIIQEVRSQMIPRQTLHEIPQALQQRSQAIQQRPVNLRLNPSNPQRRVTNVTNYPVHNDKTTAPSVVPIHHPEVPKVHDVKAEPIKEETVPNNPVVHILIPKETPDSDGSHKTAEFFEDEDDEKDNMPMHHEEYFNKMAVNGKRLNKLETKDHNLDKIVTNKKRNKIQPNNAEIKTTSDNHDVSDNVNDDNIISNQNILNEVKEQKKGKLNDIDDDQSVHHEGKFSPEISKDDQNTEKKTPKQPALQTAIKTDKNQNRLTHSLTKNIYTGDNIISVKARNGEKRNKDSTTVAKENATPTHLIQNDKIDNVLIQNCTYEEIYERSINSNSYVYYNKRPSNIQTLKYSTYSDKYQDNSGDNKSPKYLYTEYYSNQIPSTSNIKCEYTNSYENDPIIFLNEDNKPSVAYINANQINSVVYDKPTNIDVADYYTKGPDNYIDRMWRTWRNSEVRINNNIIKPNNDNMDYKIEVPSAYIKEPVNAVIPTTNRNLIDVNGCYKNQNKPVTCRYCPSYQCYY